MVVVRSGAPWGWTGVLLMSAAGTPRGGTSAPCGGGWDPERSVYIETYGATEVIYHIGVVVVVMGDR